MLQKYTEQVYMVKNVERVRVVCDTCLCDVDEQFNYVIKAADDFLEDRVFCSTPCFRKFVIEWGTTLLSDMRNARSMFLTKPDSDDEIPF